MSNEKFARLHYIDVCKGILIIIVVLHHVFGLMRQYKYLPEQTDYLEKLYVPFFMAAFFVVTGFCSNFNKEFKPFFWESVKKLIVPAVIFYFLMQSIDMLITQGIDILGAEKIILRFIIFGGSWFLTSLFLAKQIAYWLINNNVLKGACYSNIWGGQILIVSLVLLLISSVLSTYQILEPYKMYHSLGLTFFLFFGIYLRKHNIGLWTFITSLTVYVIYVYMLIHYDMHLPRITSKLSLYPHEIPFFLIGAISGTLIVWYISKIIDRNSILEYLGRNSLVIYLTHWIIIKTLIVLWQLLFPDLKVVPSIMFFSLFVTALLLSIGLVRVFQHRRISWMIGKY